MKIKDKIYFAKVSTVVVGLALLQLLVIIPGFKDTGFLGRNGEPQGKYTGLCPKCYEAVYGHEIYVECTSCFEFVAVKGDDLVCESCGTELSALDSTERIMWIYHNDCDSLIWYPWFLSYNGGDDQDGGSDTDMTTVISVKGEFDKSGSFHASPWYIYNALPSLLTGKRSGEYAVYVYDDKGERLAVSYFDMEDNSRVTTSDGTETKLGEFIPVELVVRFNDEAARIVIKKGDEEIYSREVSKRAPKVFFKEHTEVEESVNSIIVSWEATDEDGEELYFKLWYTPDGVKTYLLAADIQERSFEVDLTKYPGSENGYFYIYATDGVRTTEAKSASISVRYNAPKFLTEQIEIPKVKVTEEIYYKTKIYDDQDGWLSGSSVSWMLNGEEVSITSVLQTWPYQLEPGLHTFTCIATNSADLSTQKDFKFEIIDDESDLPDDWSRPEIVYALKKGYIVSISRMEAPITRGQFADLMFMLFYHMNPEGLPYYDKDLVTDSGEDNYSEFMMASLGLMEAPGGIFQPHKSMSQRDAVKILYQTWMLAANPDLEIKDLIYNEDEAVEFLINNEVLNEDGENVFQPEEKMSKKLALVWISRIDRWVFPEEEE